VEMDRLRQELAKPPSTSVQVAPQPVVAASQPEDPTPAIEKEDLQDPEALDDDRLDAVDRKIIEVVQKLEQAGVRATDELVASRLPPNPQTDISYHRVTVNKRRCKLREGCIPTFWMTLIKLPWRSACPSLTSVCYVLLPRRQASAWLLLGSSSDRPVSCAKRLLPHQLVFDV
jgi:hypothetical protein